jgi:hypothetical protein
MNKEGFTSNSRGFCYGRNIYRGLVVVLSGRMESPPVPCTTIRKSEACIICLRFTVYLTTFLVAQNTWRQIVGWLVIVSDAEGRGRGLILSTIPAFTWPDRGHLKKNKLVT